MTLETLPDGHFVVPHFSSLKGQFETLRKRALARVQGTSDLLTLDDLGFLPAPVRRYVIATGFVGRPRVQSFELQFRGRIRGAAEDGWMPFEARQVSMTEVATRLFWMRARKLGMPIQVLHRMWAGQASMHVRALSVLPVADTSGVEMDRSEAVTHLNDLCILCPGSLVQRQISWEPLNSQSARVYYTGGRVPVAATLYFDQDGMLRNFVSDDRMRALPSGKGFESLRFSTPIRAYARYGVHHLASHGEARWHMPGGPFCYGEFELVGIEYDVHRRHAN